MESFQWLKDLFTTTDSVAHIALLYAIVIAIGVYLGKIKVFGISLGVTFVLFDCSHPDSDVCSGFRTDTLCVYDWYAGGARFL